ncbi:hypothetical protein PENTCL1PPCAC_15960, partial [Pristionchus entomophagus]
MREAVYDLACSTLLGLGNMFMFMGYDSQLTFVEPVLHSVHDRSPDTIDAHAGFYGTLICVLFFDAKQIPREIITKAHSSVQYTLLIGSLLFTVQLVTFQFIHFLVYYIWCAAVGVGYALFYSGHGGYLTEHSTKKTIHRNSALSWGLATSSMIAGGFILALTARKPFELADSAA